MILDDDDTIQQQTEDIVKYGETYVEEGIAGVIRQKLVDEYTQVINKHIIERLKQIASVPVNRLTI